MKRSNRFFRYTPHFMYVASYLFLLEHSLDRWSQYVNKITYIYYLYVLYICLYIFIRYSTRHPRSPFLPRINNNNNSLTERVKICWLATSKYTNKMHKFTNVTAIARDTSERAKEYEFSYTKNPYNNWQRTGQKSEFGVV